MSRGYRFTLVLALGLVGCVQAVTAPPPAALPPVPVGSGYLVGTVRPLTLPDGWQQEVVMPGMTAVHPPAGTAVTARQTLRDLPGVTFVEANARMHLVRPILETGLRMQAEPPPYVPNDPEYPSQWNMTLAGIDRAWNLTKGLKTLKIGVVDSGVDPQHPDLVDNLLPLIDIWKDVHGTDKFTFGGRAYTMDGKDGNGHGTHVTGILAAAIDNSTGVAGTAGQVKIQPIKATDYEGNTDALTLFRSVKRAIDEGCKVINVSIGGDGTGDPDLESLRTTVAYAYTHGVIIVAATGNESARSRKLIQNVTLPAAYPGAIAVAAVTQYDKIAEYSNGGPQVAVAAPGGAGITSEGRKIRSTLPTYTTYLSLSSRLNGPYGELAGTSMACPHVSGLAALLLSQEPTLTPSQVCRRIALTCDDVGVKGWDADTGFGRINAYRALSERVE
ncbi:MAG: S8 family serine peptidase [Candidatus Sericytochromatia bacterium]|nr:S8 family serine peptidase [Candidatus Sericytochromatia bacterium]